MHASLQPSVALNDLKGTWHTCNSICSLPPRVMQIGDSELIHHLRQAAPDREHFNQQLQDLGMYSLME